MVAIVAPLRRVAELESLALRALSARIAMQERGPLDQEGTEMMRTFFCIDDDNERALRRDRNEVRVRHGVTFAAEGLDFVGGEGNGAIELANGRYDHPGL